MLLVHWLWGGWGAAADATVISSEATLTVDRDDYGRLTVDRDTYGVLTVTTP